MNLGTDPAELLDDAGVEQLLELSARYAFDALAWQIYLTLADRPMSWFLLLRLMRADHPRLLPAAIERAVGALLAQRHLEVDQRRRLCAKRIKRIGFNLTRRAA